MTPQSSTSSKTDESAYGLDVEQLAVWCSPDNLELNSAQNSGDDSGNPQHFPS